MVTFLRNKIQRAKNIACNLLGLSPDLEQASGPSQAGAMADDDNLSTAAGDNASANTPADDATQIQSERSSLKRGSPHDGREDAVKMKKQKVVEQKIAGSNDDDCGSDGDDWQTVSRSSKKQKKIPRPGKNYPSITFSPNGRLQSKIGVSHLRDLVTYIFADGTGPQWCAVTHRPAFRKIVTLMVPGLEEAMFQANVDLSKFNETRDDDLTAPGKEQQQHAAAVR
ncbi:hypothetical protein NQ176_g1053 [Zarea fungicola]|uniref:Uncharacterized protein n=1 Tax=Zarea fungicola TaxID=93591 RepID=A0ACC1NWS3_9HYPO|nr:hypothetical protein NQ176_g1053 [Lecanicillium fungicola]